VGEAEGSAVVDSGTKTVLEIASGAEVDVEIAAGSAVRVRIVDGVEAEVESDEGVNGAEGGREVVESAESVGDGGNAEDAEHADGEFFCCASLAITRLDRQS